MNMMHRGISRKIRIRLSVVLTVVIIASIGCNTTDSLLSGDQTTTQDASEALSTAESFVSRYGIYLVPSDDPSIGALAVHESGEILGAITEEDRVTGSVWIAPEGGSIVVEAGRDGLPERAVVGDWVLLFSNYTTDSVDIAAIAPDGTISTFRDVPVDPSSISSLRAGSTPGGQGRMLAISPSGANQTLTAADQLRIASTLMSIASCAITAIPAAALGPAGILWVAAQPACWSALLGTASVLLPGDNPGLEMTVIALDTVGCMIDIGMGLSCGAAIAGAAAHELDSASESVQARAPEIRVAESELAASPMSTPTATEGDWTPESIPLGRIIFLSREHGYPNIYVMEPDGTVGRLTFNQVGHDNTPSWSPDGTSIAFVRAYDQHHPRELRIMDAEMGDPDGLSSEVLHEDQSAVGIAYPNYSPDGSLILFMKQMPSYQQNLYVIPSNGGVPTQLTFGCDMGGGAGWSPDGTQIAYIGTFNECNNDSSRRYLMLMNADGTGKQMLLDQHGSPINWVINTDISWSPDGARLLLMQQVTTPPTGTVLYTYDLETRALTEIFMTWQPQNMVGADWLPDGTIVFGWWEGNIGRICFTSSESQGTPFCPTPGMTSLGVHDWWGQDYAFEWTSPGSGATCPNTLASRLVVGEYAYVSPHPLGSNRIRSGPGLSHPVISHAQPEAVLEVLEGPVCGDDVAWWRIRVLDTGDSGWTAEGNSQEYWLEPCPSQSNCPSPGIALEERYPLIEEFDSAEEFTSTDPDVYIENGRVYWTIHVDEGLQYVYRSIPAFSGPVRLTVVGQVDWASNNCYVKAGIGSGLAHGEHIAVTFGFTGGGCSNRGYIIHAKGVELRYRSDGCSFTREGVPWISGGQQYTAVLTIADTSTLEIDGVGSYQVTPIYDGIYDTLMVGFPGPGDWPSCGGSIERIIVEPLVQRDAAVCDPIAQRIEMNTQTSEVVGGGSYPANCTVFCLWVPDGSRLEIGISDFDVDLDIYVDTDLSVLEYADHGQWESNAFGTGDELVSISNPGGLYYIQVCSFEGVASGFILHNYLIP